MNPELNEKACSGECCQAASVGVENSIAGFASNLFNTSSYPARWNCGEWTALEGWLHIVSDVGIFLAYFAIPLALLYFMRKRKEFPFPGIIALFAGFIMFCGTGHLLEAVIFYYPIYRVAGLLKLATAIISWITVFALWRLIPRVLDLPAVFNENVHLHQADKAKSEFMANMSHEIRTPMTAIIGFSDILAEEFSTSDPTDHRARAVESIRRNADHLLEIVNDILDISKIEAGELNIDLRQVSPRSLVTEVGDLLLVRACNKNVELSIKFANDLPNTIQTDVTRLRQILLNVIGNAIKFTREGSVVVNVRRDRSDSGANLIAFDVTDTGIGVAQKQLARLFEPFSQADGSTTREFGGTGLGLAISKRLAVRLGGGIDVTSSPGVGSCFTVTVATGNANDAPTEAPPNTSDPETTSAVETIPIKPPVAKDGFNYRLLLAEDGVDNQRLFTHVLKKAGASVVLAPDGQAAVEKMHQDDASGQPFDAILMDMQMPRLDGYAATRMLREQGYRLPIIALTAHAMAGDREKCLAAGCDDYLTKPVDRKHLVAVVKQAILESREPVG